MSLKGLMSPKSIAVIGASLNKKKIGWQILNNLQENKYKGRIYPVNPKHKKINGLSSFASISEIEKDIDLAIIVIPAQAVTSVVEECGIRGVKNIIIISANFSESGKEGKEREDKIKKLADRFKLNILGPNCLGIINSSDNINATFAKLSTKDFKSKGLALISQSGAIGSAIFDWSLENNIPISHFISLGNKAVLDENDFLEYFKKDSKASFIALYLEEILDGKKFMKIVSEISPQKPIVILRSGKSEEGRKAAFSHTGSMTSSQKSIEAGLKRSGAIIADNLEDFFNIIKLLKLVQENKRGKNNLSDKICLISNAGGPLVATVDSLSNYSIGLSKFSDKTIEELKKTIPVLTNYQNPLDILGDAGAKRYEESLDIVARDKKNNQILILLTPQTSTEIKETAYVINKFAQKNSDKLVVSSFIGGLSVKEGEEILKKGNSVYYQYPERAVLGLSKYIEYRRNIKTLKTYSYYEYEGKTETKTENLDYLEALNILKKYSIPILETKKVENVSNLSSLNYPIALKVVSPKIIHKTDDKALEINVKDRKEASAILNRFKNKFREGYVVSQPMAKDFLEIILGFKRDKSFGPIIMVGLGGIYTEVFRDVQIEVDDIDEKRARDMIKKLKSYPIIKGTRGEYPYDIDALTRALVNLARLARENLNIEEIDINPLFVGRKGVIAGDVRILQSKK